MKTHDIPLEAEESVLASCLIEPEQYRKIADKITTEHFLKAHHKLVWEAIKKCYPNESSMNIVAICDAIDTEKMAQYGGKSYVVALLDLPIIAFRCEDYYGKILHDQFLYRKIQILAAKISENPTSEENNLILEEIRKIEMIRKTGGYITEMPEALKDFNDHLDDMYAGRIKTFSLGFKNLDEIIGGIHLGSLLTVGARTSQGKSAFLIQTTLKFLKDGMRVLYLSNEMTNHDIFCRIMSLETNEPLWRFRKNPSKELIEKSVGIQKEIANLHFGIFSEERLTMENISASIEKFRPDILVVDYIQSIGTAKDNRAAHFSNVANNLKLIALQKKIIVLTASQLSRGILFRDDKTPTLADLKESGGIEEASDIVILVHIKDYDEQQKVRSGDLIVAKNRNGATRSSAFIFKEDCAKFMEFL